LSYKKHLVKQHDMTDCAAACLATICMYYKKETTITRLRDVLGTDIKGTTLNGLEDGARALGFDTKAIRVDKDAFKSEYTLPAIAHVITEEGLSHFVVIHKINKKKVTILDPAKGVEKKEIDEFFKIFDGILLLMVPNNEFQPGKNKSGGMLSKFIQILLPQKALFIYAIIGSVILTLLGIASSFFNKILMDEILPYGLKNELKIFVIGFLVLGITQTILSAIRQHMLLYLSQKIDIPLLLGYFKHVYKLPMKFFTTRKVGDILTRFSDASTIKNILTSISLSLSLIIDIILATVSAVILYIMNSTLFIVILALTVISAVLIYIFKGPYKRINLKQMEAGARLNSHIIESLRGVETIKILAAEEKSIEKLEVEYIKNLKIAFKEGVLSNIQGSISSVVSTAGNLILMYIGATMVIDGKITLGSLMAFTSLTGYFMDPIGRLIGLQLQIQEASISLKRISEIYEVDKEQIENDKIKIEEISGDIDIENVTFRYGSRSPVLKDVSIKIPKGKKVALVGESGSGKTTISKLLLKYYTPEEGSINISGYDIEELDIYALRKAMAYVPQNIELFSGSIRENVVLGKDNATYEEVKTACANASCNSFIEKLPAKYDTYLDEAGGGLSGGERQRLSLARALIKKSKFLILDEATSNLDFISEAKIYDTLFVKGRNLTMLIIAHRLSTIRNCDIIYVMDKGQVVEVGDHETLINKKGYYYRLYESQVGEIESKTIEEGQENNEVLEIKEKDTSVTAVEEGE